MREQGIPTSQQPKSQSRNDSGLEFQYEVPKPGGGTEIKSVQQQTLDSSHPGMNLSVLFCDELVKLWSRKLHKEFPNKKFCVNRIEDEDEIYIVFYELIKN